MHITRRMDYAVRAAALLAEHSGRGPLQVQEIADRMLIPRPFLSKVLKDLVEAGIVDSKRGRGGGYRLARPASEVSFKDLAEAVEGPLEIINCVQVGGGSCKLLDYCTQAPVWSQIQSQLAEVFASYTLEQVKTDGLGAPRGVFAPVD